MFNYLKYYKIMIYCHYPPRKNFHVNGLVRFFLFWVFNVIVFGIPIVALGGAVIPLLGGVRGGFMVSHLSLIVPGTIVF